jgi:hypothetical protein
MENSSSDRVLIPGLKSVQRSKAESLKRKADEIEPVSNNIISDQVAKRQRVQLNNTTKNLDSGIIWNAQRYSCAYDSTLTILANLYLEFPTSFTDKMREYNKFFDSLLQHWQHIDGPNGDFYLDASAAYLQNYLHTLDSASFPVDGKTGGTDLIRLLEELFFSESQTFTVRVYCKHCDITVSTVERNSAIWSLPIQETSKNIGFALKELWSKPKHSLLCTRCHRTLIKQTVVDKQSPPLLAVHLPSHGPKVQITRSISTGEGLNSTRYMVKGIIYLGDAHFTAQIVDKSGQVFYHDGITTGRQCISQGAFKDISDLHYKDGREAVLTLYCRL